MCYIMISIFVSNKLITEKIVMCSNRIFNKLHNILKINQKFSLGKSNLSVFLCVAMCYAEDKLTPWFLPELSVCIFYTCQIKSPWVLKGKWRKSLTKLLFENFINLCHKF